MVDKTPTNIPIDETTLTIENETISTSIVPLNIHRHDSKIEINNYYINYIDDLSVQSEFKTLEINEDKTSISFIEKNSCRLEVSQLIEEVIIF
jgi:hypothetical protein